MIWMLFDMAAGAAIGAIVMNRLIWALLVQAQNPDQRVALKAIAALAQLRLGLAFLKAVRTYSEHQQGRTSEPTRTNN